MENKLYCYVDETGQDTKGKYFLVVIVISDLIDVNVLDRKLSEIEDFSRKLLHKWKHTDKHTKERYLLQVSKVLELKNAIFYRIYKDSKEYTTLTAFSIAAALSIQNRKQYIATIIIDGLNDVERGIVRQELKKLSVHYKKIKGLKDEQSSILRLSDAMAGFLRDAIIDKQPYTNKYIRLFERRKIIKEI
jgi:hypothetical protein